MIRLLIKYYEWTKTNTILMRVNGQFNGMLTKVLIEYFWKLEN